jgi:hypothetical protein
VQEAKMPVPIQAAIIAALVAGLFSLLSFRLVRQKEEQTRRSEAALRHLQRQIEEFYGPLSGLLQQSRAVARIAKAKLWAPDGTMNFDSLSTEDKRLWLYLVKSHLLPINASAASLIRSKAFLIDSLEMPQDTFQFLQHVVEFELVNRLWEDAEVDSSFIEHTRFPTDFDQKVEAKLLELRGRYYYYLQRLGADRVRGETEMSRSEARPGRE